MQTCVRCGTENTADRGRCRFCGAPLTPESPSPEARRTATVVTSDLVGSTALGERLDPEVLHEILTLYFDEMRSVLEAHGGSVEKIVGDAIVAVFGLPAACEDDVLRAVTAAAETRSALAGLNERLAARWGVRLVNRTGIATGEVLVGAASAGEHLLAGAVVQLANRLEEAASPDGILIGQPTYAMVADRVTVEPAEPVALAGSGEPVLAYRLVSVTLPDAGGVVAPPASHGPGAQTCSTCGRLNSVDVRCCGSCGSPLPSAPPHETRKTVTVVFSDLRATTAEGAPLAPEVLRDVTERAFEASRRAMARHGGTIEKFIGDAVMAVFGLPARHEDDALRAVRAALDVRRDLWALAESLDRDEGLRLDAGIGVNTGEVVAGEATLGQRLVTGDAVNVAARLEQAASSLEVLVGHSTWSLVRDLARAEEIEPLTLRGKAQPVRAYRLLDMKHAASHGWHTAAMVGRDEEMAALAEAFGGVVSDRACRMVTLVGDAGVGKTRLADEFLDSIRAHARIVRGRCLPYGDGITFWPIVEVVRDAAGILETDTLRQAREKLRAQIGDDEIVKRVAAAIGLLEAPFQLAELFWGIRRCFEILAASQPLAVVIDDIHWAEPTLLDLIGRLTAAIRDAPVMLLCGSRRDLLDRQPEWGEGPGQRRIVLDPLAEDESARMIENLLGHAGLDKVVQARVLAAAEGNPLFVEQLLSMLVDSGVLQPSHGRWESSDTLVEISIPPTIEALLAARLDQLPEGERAIVDPASVIGLVFAQPALEALVDDDVRPAVPARLARLAARQLMRRHDADGGAPTYRFAHLLIRDTAYAGILKRTRARLHEAFVAWSDEANRASDRAIELEEILGYHLEQAYRYRVELAPLDAQGIAVGIDATRRLASAGRRALARGDVPAAVNLLERASRLLPEDDAGRPRLMLDLGSARFDAGQYAAAEAALEDAVAAAAARRDEGGETTARLELLLQRFATDPARVEGRVEDLIRAAVPVLERAGDEDGLGRASMFLANLRILEAQWDAAAEAIQQAIAHAQHLGDRVRETRARPLLALVARLGSMPVEQATALTEELLARSRDDRQAEAILLRTLGHLQAMRGDFVTARVSYRRGRAILEELGWTFQAALTSIDSGPIEMLAGDPVAAEAELRRDYDTLDAHGERNFITTVAAFLAEACYRQGRDEEAQTLAAFSAEVAAPDDLATQVLWRQVRAKLLAREHRFDEAERVGSEAVALSGRSDDPVGRANALLDLATVLRAAGRAGEAVAAATEALRLYERKGNVVSAGAARAFLADAGLTSGRTRTGRPDRSPVPGS